MQSTLTLLPDLTIALPCVVLLVRHVVALSRRPFNGKRCWIWLDELFVIEARGGELIRLRWDRSGIKRAMSQHAVEKISLAIFQ